ncbi:CHASE2 domain-containing protein [Sphingomonas cavernae]|uniref:histidine kinase n=1 Tax=Sphingomonas cavernae TaxID=2320861 RepID=A0A418WJR3_9SPHN|nr:CHASE2 domain-containing protein [Sphingomonas cavernae]RJF90255.1 CHASE2 domain-containing protein [Sphingomonas cavernae]
MPFAAETMEYVLCLDRGRSPDIRWSMSQDEPGLSSSDLRPLRRQAASQWLLLMLLSVVAASGLVMTRGLERLDNVAYDAMLRLSSQKASGDIVLVAIDDRSLADLGPWPWPRDTHARLLEQLGRARPRAILYDVLFLEPSPDAAGDERLSRAVGEGPVFLPLSVQAPGLNGAPVDISRPVPAIGGTAAGLGQVTVRPDDDGVLRRVPLALRFPDLCLPHLAVALTSFLKGEKAGCAAPDMPNLISYAGPAGTYPAISFSEVMNGNVPDEIVRNRIMLVGATAAGVGDYHATPMRGREDLMSGIEIQANIVDALLGRGFHQEAGKGTTLVFNLAPLLALWLGFWFITPRQGLLLAPMLAVMMIALATGLLAWGGYWMPPMAGVVTIALFTPVWSWRRLSAASSYFIGQLTRLEEEPGVFSRAGGAKRRIIPADRLEQQMELLQDAIGQVRELKNFIDVSQASLPDATLVTDTSWTILRANSRAHDLWRRYMGSEATGMMTAYLNRIRPWIVDGQEGFTRFVGEMESAVVEERECEIGLDDGRAYLLRVKSVDTRFGPVKYVIFRLADITELRSATRQRDMMLQFLTHDMRSPQVSILALLSGEGAKEVPEPYARRIGACARQTLDLAEQFVQLARAEAAEYDLQPVELGDLAIDAADQLWPQVKAAGVSIDVERDEDTLLVRGDASLLVRAITNLAGNAIKYNRRGGWVRIRVGSPDPTTLTCAVEDNGRGMQPEQIEELFKPFRRFEESAAPADDIGVGLGLVFVRTVVARHGGRIECHSTPENGTCFTLTLPRLDLSLTSLDEAV